MISSNASPPPSNQQVQVRNRNVLITNPTPQSQSPLASRIIPKIGSIVKRFSLNYSGEGLVTDPQRVRTVRVGIRFQVQVDSILNNQQAQHQQQRIIRTNSAPNSIQFLPEAENPGQRSPPLSFRSQRFLSLGSVCGKEEFDGELADSSSGVSSLSGSNPQSPVLQRRASSGSLAFHNRINQALSLCRNQLARRSNSISSPETSPLSTSPVMEDASSYQILRCFPGSNVNSPREFSWETAAFEKDVREKVQWLGSKFSSLRVPPIVHRLLGSFREWAWENPLSAILLLALTLASLLPISIFLAFAVATVCISFFGFLLIEGALLSVGGIIFAVVVILLGVLTLALVLTSSFGYLTTSQLYSFFTGRDIKDTLRRVPFIGQFFNNNTEKVPSSVGSPGSSKSNGYAPAFKPLHSEDEVSIHDDSDGDLEEEDDLVESADEVSDTSDTESDSTFQEEEEAALIEEPEEFENSLEYHQESEGKKGFPLSPVSEESEERNKETEETGSSNGFVTPPDCDAEADAKSALEEDEGDLLVNEHWDSEDHRY